MAGRSENGGDSIAQFINDPASRTKSRGYAAGPDSGPNNLRLRSETVTAGGVSRRTCYGYDWIGNRISTTRPNGLCQ